MKRVAQQTRAFVERHTPYPMAVQAVVTLALLATPFSVFGAAAGPDAGRFWTMTGLVCMLLLVTLLVPVRRMPIIAQVFYLIGQVALVTLARAIYAAPLFDYVYLAIVFQAIAIFRPRLWIPFAVGVWVVWSSSVLIAAMDVWPWLQSNLAIAFPATCAIIAAIIYNRQQRKSEQVRQMLQQMQHRYDSLAHALREIQQRVALEERQRLSRTIAEEVQLAVARTEQSVASALSQAQTNLARLQTTVAQTRDSAALAVDRLRQALNVLRRVDPPARLPAARVAARPLLADEQVISERPTQVLSWILPSVFVLLSIGLTALQRHLDPEVTSLLLLMGTLLLFTYVCTQRVRHPLLLQAGLAGQAFAVLTMTVLAQTLPLLLGLLLVLWQIVTRLTPVQIALFLTSVPTSLGVLLISLRPTILDYDDLLACGMAALAVGAPLLLARRQQGRRRQDELRLAMLAAEIERQTDEVRLLAIGAERARMAREFHDDLGSRLVLINLQLQLAEDLAAEEPDAALGQLQLSREQLRAAWQSVLVAADAELPVAAGGLAGALADLVKRARASTTAEVRLRAEGPLDELPAAVSCTIYRAVQEGLTNACKHARPAQIEIELVSESSYVTVTVRNDNMGAAPLAAPPAEAIRASYGLIGLRERAEAVGGGIEAGPTAEGGFRLLVVIPAEGGDLACQTERPEFAS